MKTWKVETRARNESTWYPLPGAFYTAESAKTEARAYFLRIKRVMDVRVVRYGSARALILLRRI